jgi:predicted nucleic acid-binding Zn finger protein
MEIGDARHSKNESSQDELIYHGGPYTIHFRAGRYVYNMPKDSWMVCWVIAGEANDFFSGFPAEIRYIIMDHYLGISTGTCRNLLGVYLSLRTGQIYWWEPCIYMDTATTGRSTLRCNGIAVPEEIESAGKSHSVHAVYRKIMGLRPVRSVVLTRKDYDILVVLRDKVLTHPRAIEITNRMIAFWDR